MNTVVRLYIALAFALGAVIAPLGASYAQAQDAAYAVVASVDDLGTLNPVTWQVDTEGASAEATPDNPGLGDVGNPADNSGVIDNPVTENPVDINEIIFMWTALLGVGSSILITFLNRAIPGISPDDNTKRAVVAALVCIAVAVIDTTIRGKLNLTNATASALIIFTAAVSFYKMWFAPSGIAGRIEGKVPTEAAVLRVQ